MKRIDPFLGNDRKQRGSRGNSTRATIELLLEKGFSTIVRANRS
jgi:hypothetical protein